MQFASTIWLWGLAGLIVPIAIHLLSRKQGKVVRFGSIRHLQETTTRQFRSIRLNEVLLLALRCLFILLLVFLLAGLQFSALKTKYKWLLIEKGLENDPKYTRLIDSLKANGFEMKALADNDEKYSGTVTTQKIDYWNLVGKLKPGSEIVVLAYNYADGFKGKRISLPEGVHWLAAEPDSMEYVLSEVELSDDSIVIRKGKSWSDKTYFENSGRARADLDSATFQPRDTISVGIFFDSAYGNDKRILIAALKAVQMKTSVSLRIEEIPNNEWTGDSRYDWSISLSKKSPDLDESLLLIDENDVQRKKPILKKSTNSNHIWVTKRLNEEVALQANLAVQLAMILQPQKRYEHRMRGFDRRALPDKLMWSSLKTSEPVRADPDNKAGTKYISFVLLLILFAERLLAFKRNQ